MSVLHKVTATDQLAFDATQIALRHHFGDRDFRWVHWTLDDPNHTIHDCSPPVVSVRYYVIEGVVEVPRLRGTYFAHIGCAVRDMEDGSRQAFSVEARSPFRNKEGEPLSDALRYMSYCLGMRHPPGRPRDVFPKFLPRKLIIPARSSTPEE
jgi:hypothetical protein